MPAKILFFLMLAGNAALAQNSAYLLIGTYTSGESEGIYVYNFNATSGDNQLVSSVKISNPSYLAIAPGQRTVYAVTENADSSKEGVGGRVSAFHFDPSNGTLKAINDQYSGGKHPCYVTVDSEGKWVFAANYSSGSASVYAIQDDGGLEPARQVVQHAGSGPDKNRQAGPHAHSTVLSPDNKYLFVQDLGTDKIMAYQFDKSNGTLTPAAIPFTQSVPGSGPRHLDFHPNNRYAYLMEEMTGTVAAYRYQDGTLESIQRISALPCDFQGKIGSADIHVSPDGRFVYCSNRGDANSITIFRIDDKSGKLTVVGHQSTLGKTPRNFSIDPTGNFLLAANEESDNVVIFKINKKTGLLTDTGKRIQVSKPVCLKWITQ